MTNVKESRVGQTLPVMLGEIVRAIVVSKETDSDVKVRVNLHHCCCCRSSSRQKSGSFLNFLQSQSPPAFW